MTIPKLKILVHLYLKKVTGKLVFKNDVFMKINLTDSQISLHLFMSAS